MPLAYTRLNQTTFLERFIAKAPVNLNTVLEVSGNIAANEAFYGFIEESTKELIGLYSGVNPNKIPPTAATITNLDCSFVTWEKEEVKNNLKNILDKGMDYIKIKGTDYDVPAEPLLKSFIFDSDLDSPNVKVNFDYDPEWGLLYFDITPKSGEGIAPPDKIIAGGIPFVPNLCTFKYRYKYDLEYPVLVTVSDSNSKGINAFTNVYEGEYSFTFPLWIRICGNQNRECTGPGPGSQAVLDKEFLDANKIYDTLFCDKNQYLSEEFTIKTDDNVNVYYSCADEINNNCFIGKSDINGELKTTLPLCVNGVMSFQKPGYQRGNTLVTTVDTSDLEVSFKMEKIKPLKASVQVISTLDFVDAYIKKDLRLARAKASALISNEQAIISLTGETTETRIYPDMENELIDFATGDYDLNYLIKADMKIEPSFVKTLGEDYEISYHESGTGTYEGIWIIGSDTYSFSLEDINDKSSIIFYVLAVKRASEKTEVNDFHDTIFVDGSIKAELLYEDDVLIDIDGLVSEDFKAKENQRVEKIIIEDYADFLSPELS